MPMGWIPSEQLFARKLACRFSTMRCVDGKVNEPRIRNAAHLRPAGHHKPKFVKAMKYRQWGPCRLPAFGVSQA